MYEDIVAEVRRTTEGAVRESQERVDLAGQRSAQADKDATEATKAVGERWTNRINAMRRRVADREKAATEIAFGPEDGHHQAEGDDELVALAEPAAKAADDETPAFGIPEDLINQQPTGRHATPDPEAARFLPAQEDPPAATRWPTPPTAPANRRTRPREDEDEDYSSQSWLQDN
jgi:hypothetical protein